MASSHRQRSIEWSRVLSMYDHSELWQRVHPTHLSCPAPSSIRWSTGTETNSPIIAPVLHSWQWELNSTAVTFLNWRLKFGQIQRSKCAAVYIYCAFRPRVRRSRLRRLRKRNTLRSEISMITAILVAVTLAFHNFRNSFCSCVIFGFECLLLRLVGCVTLTSSKVKKQKRPMFWTPLP